MTPKSSRSDSMREDDYFLSVVTADLDNFCAKFEAANGKVDVRSAVILFPSIDCRRRKLLHALISQRYQSLSHASVGVEPDRRPVAIYRDTLLKVILPTRFKVVQNGSGSMAYSEFTFCLALLETCRDSGEAKRLIERLYSFRLAEQRVISPTSNSTSNKLRHSASEDHQISSSPVVPPSTSSSRRNTVKPGCERYVPKPMRLLQEQQKKSEEKATNQSSQRLGSLESPSVADISSALQKVKLSSFDDDCASPGSPTEESRRLSAPDNELPLENSRKPVSQTRTPKNSPSIESELHIQPQVTSHQSLRKTSVSTNSGGNILPARFLGEFIGSSSGVVHVPLERYSAYRTEPPPLDYDALSHVLEISGFPKEWRGSDLQRLLPVATFIHWVDDTHVLAVLKSASDAKAFTIPPEVCISMEVRPIRNACVESKYKAHRIFDDLVSRPRKPQTSTVVVRRVLNHHLRLGLPRQSAPSSSPAASPRINGAVRDT